MGTSVRHDVSIELSDGDRVRRPIGVVENLSVPQRVVHDNHATGSESGNEGLVVGQIPGLVGIYEREVDLVVIM
jgi:hypothetical protein